MCPKSIRRRRPLATDLIESKRDRPQSNGESASNCMYISIRVAVVCVGDREMVEYR